MKNVSILVPESSVMQAIADPRHLFTAVNQFLAVTGKEPLFQVQLVGYKREIQLNNRLFTVHPDQELKDVQHTDLVIIPALAGDMAGAVAANQQLIPWIVAQYQNGAEIASLCVGAFLLASTGLLAGKKCSTHLGLCERVQGDVSGRGSGGRKHCDRGKPAVLQWRGQLVMEPAAPLSGKVHRP